MSTINVKDYLPPILDEERVFIRPKSHNKAAAMKRYSVVDKAIKEMFTGINSDEADTNDIPSDLVDKYEQVYQLLVDICIYETDIAVGVIK